MALDMCRDIARLSRFFLTAARCLNRTRSRELRFCRENHFIWFPNSAIVTNGSAAHLDIQLATGHWVLESMNA
jgi:hypothetical protein